MAPSVKSTAWYAHPEHILQAMLAEDDKALRDFAVRTILKIRGDSLFGDTSVRTYRVSDINLAADSLSELIQWSSEDTQLYEPLLTCGYSRDNWLRSFKKKCLYQNFLYMDKELSAVFRLLQEPVHLCLEKTEGMGSLEPPWPIES